MHVVTYDSERYGSLSEAVDGFNSLAVLGVFFEVSTFVVSYNWIYWALFWYKDRLSIIKMTVSLQFYLIL